MTPEEFKTKQASTGGKWIRDPGVYSVSIIEVEEKGTNQFDSQWLDFVFRFENADGAGSGTFVSVPTTAERSFLFGSKKSLREYNQLEKFLKGFGITLEYSSAISTIADLFEDATATFVGKTFSARMGYYGNHIKYNGKVEDTSTYVIANKDGTQIDPTVFKGFDAAKEYAKANNIKLQDFIKVLEVIPSETSSIGAAPAAAASDFPF